MKVAAGGREPEKRVGEPSTRIREKKPSAAKNESVKGDDLLADERARRTIRAERLHREILRVIEAAQKQFSKSPDASLGEVKRALSAVLSSAAEAVEVDFDATALVMVGIFIVLWLVLKPLLFDPMLKLFEERDVGGSDTLRLRRIIAKLLRPELLNKHKLQHLRQDLALGAIGRKTEEGT